MLDVRVNFSIESGLPIMLYIPKTNAGISSIKIRENIFLHYYLNDKNSMTMNLL